MRQLRNTVAWVCLISSCISGLYNGIYKMIYKAVINACALCDAGILTTQVIAETIFSILCSPIVICVWAFIGLMLFAIISEYDQSVKTIKSSATHGTINIGANRQMPVWSVSRVVKTPPFHGGNTSSNLVPIIAGQRSGYLARLITLRPVVQIHLLPLMEHSSVVELPAYIRRVPGSIPGVPMVQS